MKKIKENKKISIKKIFSIYLLAGVGFFSYIQNSKADLTLYSGNNYVPSLNMVVRIDGGFRFIKDANLNQYNAKKGSALLVQAAGNDWKPSLLGVEGGLPITPDLKMVYSAVAAFSTTNGNFPGFNHDAYIGLQDENYGTVLFGEDLFINNDIWAYDPMGQQNTSTSTLVYGRNWPIVKDMVEYRSPTWYGVKIGLQASFKDGNGDDGGSQSTRVSNQYGASVQYAINQLNLLAIYDEMKSDQGYTNLYSSSKEAIFAATYNFNPVELYAGYELLSAPQAGAQNPNATPINSVDNTGAWQQYYPSVYATRASMTWLGAVWTVSPKLLIRSAWYYTALNQDAGHSNLFTVGTEYSFRPNILWYTTVGEVLNQGRVEFASNVGTAPPAPGHNQFGGYSGLSISF